MKFKLFGTEIYISFLFSVIICVMLACDRTGLIIPLLFAVTLHEIGHLFAMWVLDCVPKKIRLIPAAVEIVSPLPMKSRNEIIIAVCGPSINLLLFLSLYINYAIFGSETSLKFGLVNLIIGLFNLIPVTGLDGGTILFGILIKKVSVSRAGLIMRIVSLAFAAFILIGAVFMTFRGKFNLSFYILGIYIIIMSIIKI